MYKTKRFSFAAICALLFVTQLSSCTTLKHKVQTLITPSPVAMSFEEAQNFERRHLKLANKLLDKGEWRKAQDVYEEALKRLPHSEALQLGLQDMYKKNIEHIEKLQQKLAISKGIWLDKNRHLYKNLANAELKGKKFRYEYKTIKTEVELLSKQLNLYGERAAANNQHRNAKYLFDLAEKLKSDKKSNEIIIETSDKKSVKTASKPKQLEELISYYKHAYQNNDLQAAYKFIDRASKLSPNNQDIKTKRAQLEKEINEKVTQYLAAGLQLYSDGNYEQALDYWQKTIKLDPNNQEALNNIERTKKVLSNLSRIKEKQEEPSKSKPDQ